MAANELPTKARINEVFQAIELLRTKLDPSFYWIDKRLEKIEQELLNETETKEE